MEAYVRNICAYGGSTVWYEKEWVAAVLKQEIGWIVEVQRWVVVLEEAYGVGWIDDLFVLVSLLGSKNIVYFIFLAYWLLCPVMGLKLFRLLGVTVAVCGVVKTLFAGPRPMHWLDDLHGTAAVEGVELLHLDPTKETSFGFPSGHVLAATTLATFFVWFFGRMQRADPSARGATAWASSAALSALAAAWVLSMCLSRVLTAAHFPHDVLGGFLLGFFVTALDLTLLVPSQSAAIGSAAAARPSAKAPERKRKGGGGGSGDGSSGSGGEERKFVASFQAACRLLEEPTASWRWRFVVIAIAVAATSFTTFCHADAAGNVMVYETFHGAVILYGLFFCAGRRAIQQAHWSVRIIIMFVGVVGCVAADLLSKMLMEHAEWFLVLTPIQKLWWKLFVFLFVVGWPLVCAPVAVSSVMNFLHRSKKHHKQ